MLLPATVILGFFSTSFKSPRMTAFTGFIVMVGLVGVTTVGAVILFVRSGRRGCSAAIPAAPPRARG
jgi:hypothetical protein